MPAGEVIDYIKIINDERRKEQEAINAEIAEKQATNNVHDVSMAGNTVPGSLF